jgi:hypothetical protein
MAKITLKKYMTLLAMNNERLSDFITDPGLAVKKAGLSPEDQAVLLSGNPSLIYATLAGNDEWWTGEKRK